VRVGPYERRRASAERIRQMIRGKGSEMTNEERAAKVAAINERLQRPALPVTGVDRGTASDRAKGDFIRSLAGKDTTEGDNSGGAPDSGKGDGAPAGDGGAEPTLDELKAKIAEREKQIAEMGATVRQREALAAATAAGAHKPALVAQLVRDAEDFEQAVRDVRKEMPELFRRAGGGSADGGAGGSAPPMSFNDVIRKMAGRRSKRQM
jgi:hypothetical protein